MNYLLDKKNKRKKIKKIALVVISLFFVLYFMSGILSGLSSVFSFIFRPVLILGNNIKSGFSKANIFLDSKKLLLLENEVLKLEIAENKATLSNYNSILSENNEMKEILGRNKENRNLILASILSKPNRSLYDTLLIDLGIKNGIVLGQRVFARGDVPIGRIGEVSQNSAKVILYSSPGEKTDVIISDKLASTSVGLGENTFMQIIGRGGGNFEMILPRDFLIEKGMEVVLPGIIPHTMAIVGTTLSDPRDSYQKALLISPVNIFELKFVEVER